MLYISFNIGKRGANRARTRDLNHVYTILNLGLETKLRKEILESSRPTL